ncbi:MAG: aminotransferase class IV [Calditrichia bacterium]
MHLYFKGEWVEYLSEEWVELLRLLSSGQALFETLHFEQEKLWFWKEHLERLTDSLRFFKCDCRELPDEAELVRQLKLKGVAEARVKIVVALPFEKPVKSVGRQNLFILVEPLTQALLGTPQKLITAPTPFAPNNPLNGHKTINYGFHFYYRRIAAEEGADDVLYLDQNGFLMETSIANIFGVKGNRIYTPALNYGILPGTVRKVLMRHWPVTEIAIHIDEVGEYDYFFLTGAVKELRPVAQIDQQVFGNLESFEEWQKKWKEIKQAYLQGSRR